MDSTEDSSKDLKEFYITEIAVACRKFGFPTNVSSFVALKRNDGYTFDSWIIDKDSKMNKKIGVRMLVPD